MRFRENLFSRARRPVISASMRIGDDRNAFSPPFVGSLTDLIFDGSRHLRLYGTLVSFIVRNCDFSQYNPTDVEGPFRFESFLEFCTPSQRPQPYLAAIRITHVNRRNQTGVRFENCSFSRRAPGPAVVTRDYLEYANRGYLSPDVKDWAPLIMTDIFIVGGGVHLPVRIGVYGGRNVGFNNVTVSNNAGILISNSSDVIVQDSIFDGGGIKFSQDSRRVKIADSRFENMGSFNFQGEERPVSLAWNPRGIGNIADILVTNCKFANFTRTSNRTNSYAAIHFGRAIEAPYSISRFVRSNFFVSLFPCSDS